MTGRQQERDRDVVRAAFRRATQHPEPDVGPLVGALPRLMAEAERRRSTNAGGEVLASIIELARSAVPRLAAVTAALVLIATLVGSETKTGTTGTDTEIDRLILTGKLGDSVSDLLLDGMVERSNDDG